LQCSGLWQSNNTLTNIIEESDTTDLVEMKKQIGTVLCEMQNASKEHIPAITALAALWHCDLFKDVFDYNHTLITIGYYF